MTDKWLIQFHDGNDKYDVCYAAQWRGHGYGFTFNRDAAERFVDQDSAETALIAGFDRRLREVATVVKA